MRKIKLGIIGLNHGLVHLKNVQLLKGEAKVAALCANSITLEREKIAKDLSIEIHTNFKHMIDNSVLDGVIICTPNDSHREIAEYCIERKLPVLLEKPIATNLDDACRIAKCAQENNVQVLVGHHRRFFFKVNYLRNLINSGEIGEVIGCVVLWAINKPNEYFKNSNGLVWQAQKNKGGGPLFINAIHEIDTLRYLLGDIEQISGIMSNKVRNFEVEDSAVISIKFESGALCSLFMTDTCPSVFSYENTSGENPVFLCYNKDCSYFFGTKGTITFPQFVKMDHIGRRGWTQPIKFTHLKSQAENQDPLLLELQHFCRVIRGEEQSLVSPDDAVKTLKAVLMIKESREGII